MSAPSPAKPVTLMLQPRDPIVARDARPFSADPGARAETLAWPLPRTLAGALRSHAGRTLGWAFDGDPQAAKAASERAYRIAVAGPLLLGRRAADAAWTVYVPAPRDAVTYRDEQAGPAIADQRRILSLRPWTNRNPHSGCLWPDGAADLQPLAVTEDVKPAGEAEFWSLADVQRWLLARTLTDWQTDAEMGQWPRDTIARLPRETRIHVKMDHDSGTGAEGFLFATEGLAFQPQPVAAAGEEGKMTVKPATAILCRATMPDGLAWPSAPALLPLGGERRLAALTAATDALWPEPPGDLVDALTGETRLRLQLVTPASFNGSGWRPDWLTDAPLTGVPPNMSGLNLKLVAAAVSRRTAVSGWNLQARRERATRYAVPAGSAYFFSVDRASGLTADEVRALWLGSLCQGTQDRNDGFGLALPGLW